MALGAGVVLGALTLALGIAPGTSIADGASATASSNCLGADRWQAEWIVRSADPGAAAGWRLDAPRSIPAGGGYQSQAAGLVFTTEHALTEPSASLTLTVSWEGGATGVPYSVTATRPTECVLAPPPAPPAGGISAPASVTDTTMPATRAAPSVDPAPAPVAPAPAAPTPRAQGSQSAPAAPAPEAQELPSTGDETTYLAIAALLCCVAGAGLLRVASSPRRPLR